MSDMHSLPLDTLLMRTFLEVVERASFAAAAERLALTPSAVSGHIKRLEETSGAALLIRTTRSVELTKSGMILYTYAKNILDLEREARAKLRGSPLRGHLRIGASEDFASTWLPQALREFHSEHPAATFELKVGITLDLLREQDRGRLDLVFGKQCGPIQVAGQLLWEEPLIWVFAADKQLDPDQPLPLALFPKPCVYRETATTALNQADRKWRMVFESSSMAGCVSAAQAGLAATVLAESQSRDGLRRLGCDDGLPKLPPARFYAFVRTETPASVSMVAAARLVGDDRRFRPQGSPPRS